MFLVRVVLMGLRGLQTNLVRSLLATLGVIIGVGAVVAAVSILEGAQKDLLQGVESLGADQVLVFNGRAERQSRQMSMPSLVVEDVDAIAEDNPDVVVAVAPFCQGGGQIKYLQKNVPAAVLGTNEHYAKMNSCEVKDGRFLTRTDVRGRAMVVVLGYKVAQDLFGALPAVGQPVKINNRGFTVVGVMEERGFTGATDVDNQVIVPVSTAMNRMFGRKYLDMLAVQCESADQVTVCIERVKRTLRGTHRLKAGEPDDFQVFTQELIMKQLGQFSTLFAVVFYSIAGISLVVGGIGIMNIMLVSVTERTREIGVRMAVGARRFDILVQFLIEASIISLLGGLVGVGFGWMIADVIGQVTTVLNPYTPKAAIVAALTMAAMVGIVSGIYPAIRAARLDPVLALRFE
jgi:putative ABC transport system permease protein